VPLLVVVLSTVPVLVVVVDETVLSVVTPVCLMVVELLVEVMVVE
jgi:hypothetical protein